MPAEKFAIQGSIQAAKNFFAEGDFARAGEICREIAEADPGNAEACHLLGVIADREGEPGHAVRLITRAISLKPGTALYYNNLGNAYRGLADPDAAAQAYRKALGLNPSFAEAHYNLGNVMLESGRLPEAVASFKKAIGHEPDMAPAYFGLGMALKELGFTGPATDVLQQAVRLRDNYPQAHYHLGLVLIDEGRLREAKEHLERALHLRPDFAEACYSLANVHRDMDEPGKALAAYRELLRIKPDFYRAYGHISSLVNQRTAAPYYAADHADVRHVLRLLESRELAPENAMDLHFALGDMYDNCDHFDEAFRHYRQGNRLKHARSEFDPVKTRGYMARIAARFDRAFFQGHGLNGSASTLPVFIVGLPRSGKSMAEKLMKLHHGVYAGGELMKLHRLVTVDLPMKLKAREKFPDFVPSLEQAAVLEVAQEYEKTLARIAGGAAGRVTNTLPYNIFYLGIIGVMFPGARIVYCRRDPLDNCLATYCKHFGRGNQYACSLEEIGIFYGLSERLMAHWKNVLPLPLFEVDYDAMVAAPEETARRLVRFLGLAWDDGCVAGLGRLLAPGELGPDGPSFQNFHKRFVGRAGKYRKFLGPLENSLAARADLNSDAQAIHGS